MKETIKSIFYRLLEIANRGKGVERTINGNKVRFPASWSRYFAQNYERENFKFIEASVHRGDIVIDIGAHIGLYGVVLGQIVGDKGHVYCFEPTPSTHSVLQKTIKINDLSQVVTPRTEALSDAKGQSFFYVSDIDGDNSNTLVGTRGMSKTKVDIDLISVDEFVQDQKLNRLDFIKIDAEGNEHKVLLGMTETILRFQPKIILALHPKAILEAGSSLPEIWSFLTEHNMIVSNEKGQISEGYFCDQNDLFDVHITF